MICSLSLPLSGFCKFVLIKELLVDQHFNDPSVFSKAVLNKWNYCEF